MRRWIPLWVTLAIAGASIAACSGGSRADGATVIGRVQDESGAPIDDADVVLDGESTNTTASGNFTFAAKRGTSLLDVSADGFRRVTVELRIASGDNLVEITMVVCTPAIDVGCDVATPTPTPTPTPPNVVALFVGANGNVDPVDPGLSTFSSWSGSAVLTGLANTLDLGNFAESASSDLAFSECWVDANETNDWDGAGVPDHCVFWWEGQDEGGIVNASPIDDAVFYVRIPGVEFTAGNTVTFADGMSAGYYEGDFAVDGFRIADYQPQTSLQAIEGTLTLGSVGMGDGQAASITGQASFYIPNFP